jgi:hypothetical protein
MSITVGQYRDLKAEEEILFNGLKWTVSKRFHKPKEVKQAAQDLRFLRGKIRGIEAEIRESLEKKKTIAKATA